VLAQGDTCVKQLWANLPIGEKELLSVKTTWPIASAVAEGTRKDAFLRSTGYTNPEGALPQNVVVLVISSCGSNGRTLELVYVKGQEGERDENVYLVSWIGDSVASRSLIASLQTTCEFTFLRACQVDANGSLIIQQLQHNFNCETDEFIKTDTLPSFVVVLIEDKEIQEIVEELKE